MRAGDRACRIVRLIAGSVEKNLDTVADHLRNRAFMRENYFRHSAHIFVEQWAKDFRCRGFHQ